MDFDEKFFQEELRSGYLVSEKMKKVWAVELELLDYIAKLCHKHNLQYFVDYGTLLGAVRHQGFIPWDDDIDIVMFRGEYEKLKVIAQEEVCEPYFFQNSYTDSMIWAFSKLRDSRTTAIEFPDYLESFHQGIFIDIFPLDDVPDGTSQTLVVEEMKQELWLSVVSPESLKAKLEQGHSFILDSDIILELLHMSVRERMKNFESFCNSQSGISSRVNFITDEFQHIIPSVPRECYEKTVYLPFENRMVPAPIGYAELLEYRYGDYMTPAQIPNLHDGIFFDPETPYRNYMNSGMK